MDKDDPSGPYYVGQEVNPCGCYYPDVTRVKDDATKRVRILFCRTHNAYEVPLGDTPACLEPTTIPTEEEREKERQELRRLEAEGAFAPKA